MTPDDDAAIQDRIDVAVAESDFTGDNRLDPVQIAVQLNHALIARGHRKHLAQHYYGQFRCSCMERFDSMMKMVEHILDKTIGLPVLEQLVVAGDLAGGESLETVLDLGASWRAARPVDDPSA